MYKIMLVDDHPLFRMGLKRILQHEPGLKVVFEAENPNQGWIAFQREEVDLVVCDLSFQQESGLTLVKRIRSSGSLCPILILSMHDEHFWAERALQEGVNGYVMKDRDTSIVIAAINSVLNGQIYLANSVQQSIFRQISGLASEGKSLQSLSARENEIFQHMSHKMTTLDIAKTLFISVKTVQAHQANIKKKLGIDTLLELRELAQKYLGMS